MRYWKGLLFISFLSSARSLANSARCRQHMRHQICCPLVSTFSKLCNFHRNVELCELQVQVNSRPTGLVSDLFHEGDILLIILLHGHAAARLLRMNRSKRDDHMTGGGKTLRKDCTRTSHLRLANLQYPRRTHLNTQVTARLHSPRTFSTLQSHNKPHHLLLHSSSA